MLPNKHSTVILKILYPTRNSMYRILFSLLVSFLLQASIFAQTPLKDQAITFNNDSTQLKGWLNLPDGEGPFPLVILIQGSDSQPVRQVGYYRMMASHFISKGIAVFYYDKRGVGASHGDHQWATLHILAADVAGAVQKLKTHNQINPDQIGVWGISQGGWIGPLAASLSSDISFVAMTSGALVSPHQQKLFDYHNNSFIRGGLNKNQAQKAVQLLDKILTYYEVPSENNREIAQSLLDEAVAQAWIEKTGLLKNELRGIKNHQIWTVDQIGQLRKQVSVFNWYAKVNNYDPLPTIQNLDLPILAIYGNKDSIVDIKGSISLIKKLNKESQNAPIVIKVIEDAPHSISRRDDNGQLIFFEGYLETLSSWILNQVQ